METNAETVRRRRRRSGSSASGSGRIQRANNRRFGRVLFAAMACAAAAVGLTQTVALGRETPGYGPFLFGMTETEARDLGAVPPGADAPLRSLALARDGATYAVEFDGGGRLQRVGCRQDPDAIQRCAEAYRIRIGMPETELHRSLGAPDSRRTQDGDVLLGYSAAGLHLRLNGAVVTEIARSPAHGQPALMWLVLHRALP